MKINKKVKVFIALLLTLTLVYATQPKESLGKDLSDVDKRLKNSIIFYIGNSTSYVNNAKTTIDSTNHDIHPILKDGRTIIPLRFLSEKLGAKVDWDNKTSTASIILEDKVIKVTNNSNKMSVDGKDVTLDVVPQIINERMFVPLRAIAEAFDKKVFWDRGLIIISNVEDIFDINSEKLMIDEIISRINVLPTVDTYDNLKNLLSKFQTNNNKYRIFDSIGITNFMAEKSTTSSEFSSSQSMGDSDYSKTNIQVEGVDEADIVKNDGEFIYQVNDKKIVIIKAYPVEDMKIVSTIPFDDKNYSPQEIYIDSKHMAVIGTTYADMPIVNSYEQGQSIKPDAKTALMPPYYHSTRNMTKAIIYDIGDKSNIKQLREVEIEGNYISSRKIGSCMYLISNKWINYYYIQDRENDIVPCYKDTNVKKDYTDIDYRCIHYFPGFSEPNYMIVAGINLDNQEPANIFTCLGSSQNIYASLENLYVASTKTNYEPMVYEKSNTIARPISNYSVNTLVHKFSLSNGNVAYKGKGEVPGTILNQFSMDENKGHFRIATTKGDMWRQDEYTSKNNIYVLGDDLNIIGKIEDIAPGEKIYSTRFMGDRAYMVTFKNTDPLFVIDMKDPKEPKILGKLKIPGYSDYLHPYDENHIIGFGKDAVEAKEGNFAWYQGMKIALFDVTDVNDPKEKFKEIIGDRGTDSELLRNHKALLFSKEKNLLAFPITLMKIDGPKTTEYGGTRYGEFAYQGAYIYSIDLVEGFKLRGTITHISDEEYKKAGSYWHDHNKMVERIMYTKDALYTVSKSMIKANDLSTLQEIKKLTIN